MMSSRKVVNVSMENVNTLRTVLLQIRKPFAAKVDPCASLAAEIEAYKQQIWKCVQDGKDNNRAGARPNRAVAAPKPVASPTRSGGSQHRGNTELQVFALKVVDLKNELKARGLPTNGRKKELRERLIEAMVSNTAGGQLERIEEQEEPKTASPKEVEFSPKQPVVVVPSAVVDIPEEPIVAAEQIQEDAEMTEAVESNENDKKTPFEFATGENQNDHKTKKEEQTTIPECDSSVEKGSQVSTSRDYWMNKVKPSPVPQKAPPVRNNVPKYDSTNNLSSSGPSPLRSVVKSAIKVMGTYNQPTSDRLDDPADDESPPSSEVSSSVYSKISGTKVRELVCKISSSSLQSSASKSGGGGSALSKNLQAKKEARLARMAEIREKSKPVTGGKVALQPKEYTSTLTSLSATAASATGKTKDLAAMRAQMREKAAAASKQARKENIPSNSNTTPQPSSFMKTTSSTGKRALPSSLQADGMAHGDMLGTTLKQGFLKKAKVASPMSTYEISDREDSDTDDSDDSDDESRGNGKKIPSWATKQELYRALEQQYGDSRRVDPDDLFSEVQTCDLEAIFGKNKEKTRYKNRTSSANWKHDQVTMQEKLVYKRKMGFDTQSHQETGEI